MNYKFDEQIKLDFINYTKINYDESTIKARLTVVNKICEFEENKNLSILDMNINNLKEFLSKSNCSSLNSIDVLFTHLKKYILYAIGNEKHDIKLLERKELGQFINNNLQYKKYITQSEYEIYCEREGNYQDIALLILLWNGLYGEKYSDIRDIKTEQFNFVNRTLTLKNGIVLYFSNRENELLELAKNELYYKQYDIDDKITKETPYIEGKYFIKHSQGVANKNFDTNYIPSYTINLRLTRYFNKIKISGVDGYNVFISGLIYRCFQDNNFEYINTREMQNQIKENIKISYNKLTEAKSIIEIKLCDEGLMNPNIIKKIDKNDINEVIKKYINGEFKYLEAVEYSGVSNSTFSRYLKKYKESIK